MYWPVIEIIRSVFTHRIEDMCGNDLRKCGILSQGSVRGPYGTEKYVGMLYYLLEPTKTGSGGQCFCFT
jgi:hypothetical protein